MARRTRALRLTGLTMATLAVAGFTASLPARAQDDRPAALLLILDGSGSMNATDDAGRPLIDLAKEALTAIINLLPDAEVEVGLRVYGHRTPNTDQAVGCTDSELVVPVGPLDQSRMVDAIYGVRPSGFTPIGLSLTEAADDLAGYDNATVILVSDGEDTCAPPDPCEVAAGLVAEGIKVNTVGFYLEDGAAARDQLECIAAATDGTYRDADAAANLAGVVGVFVREIPGVGNFHIPLNGSIDPATAPLIPVSSEDYIALQTTIDAGEARWFAVDVPAGHVIDVFGDARGFVEAAIPAPGDVLTVTILDPDGRSVGVRGRFGLDRIDLGEFLATGIGYLQTINVGTSREISTYEQFEEEWMVEGLEYLGYDEATWNAQERLRLRYERRGPLPSGTYLIGVAWESDLDASTTFDHLIGVWRDPTSYSSPADLTGSTDPTSPTALPELPEYDPWPFDRSELDPVQELYAEGPIAPGETRWFSLDVEWDVTLLADALLAAPEGSPLPSDDRLSIEILDPLGESAARPHPGGAPAQGTVSELTTYHGEGFERRPLVSAAARHPGPETPPPGRYLIGVTWTSTANITEAKLEVRIGKTQPPDGMVELPVVEAATPTTPTVVEQPDTPPTAPGAGVPVATDTATPTTVDDDPTAPAVGSTEAADDGASTPIWIAIIALVIIAAGGATWYTARRR